MITKPDVRLDKVQFFHFRFMENGTIMPQGGMTVCYNPMKDLAHLAYSTCSMVDTYNKHLGRIRSKGRTMSNAYTTVVAKPENYDKLVSLVSGYANDILSEQGKSTGLIAVYSRLMAKDTNVDFVLHTRRK